MAFATAERINKKMLFKISIADTHDFYQYMQKKVIPL
jgi:hypothetical protein